MFSQSENYSKSIPIMLFGNGLMLIVVYIRELWETNSNLNGVSGIKLMLNESQCFNINCISLMPTFIYSPIMYVICLA